MSRKTPPAYVAHRTVLALFILSMVLVLGYGIGETVPGVFTLVENAFRGLREIWADMDWDLF
uniref:Uncharacterized protein n=1 Tax=uncultured bacterium esnapd2 TaxID=1366601 RepID=S5TLU8_9BACT|nr:hypothetical protein [uncultured bacterium esnapd2]